MQAAENEQEENDQRSIRLVQSPYLEEGQVCLDHRYWFPPRDRSVDRDEESEYVLGRDRACSEVAFPTGSSTWHRRHHPKHVGRCHLCQRSSNLNLCPTIECSSQHRTVSLAWVDRKWHARNGFTRSSPMRSSPQTSSISLGLLNKLPNRPVNRFSTIGARAVTICCNQTIRDVLSRSQILTKLVVTGSIRPSGSFL